MNRVRSLRRFVLLSLIALSGPTVSRAQLLVWSVGNSQSSTQTVANYLNGFGLFPSVTAHDGFNLTITDLAPYTHILFYTNSSSGANMVDIGNTLASFANSGRGLVLATFSWANQGSNTLAGDIITQGLSPFVFTGSSAYSNVSMVSNDGSAIFNGVSTVTGHYHDRVAITAGSVLRATWSDGYPLVGQRGNVIAINLFPDETASGTNLSGNYRQLFANALIAVPEPSTYAMLATGMAMLYLRVRRRLR